MWASVSGDIASDARKAVLVWFLAKFFGVWVADQYVIRGIYEVSAAVSVALPW